MKTFAILFTVCIVSVFAGTLPEEKKAKLKEYKEECAAATGLSTESIEKAKKGDYTSEPEKLNCFAACFLKKIGFMNADGVLDEEVIRAKIPADLPKEKVDQIINKCKSLTGENICETGGKVFKCYLENKSIFHEE